MNLNLYKLRDIDQMILNLILYKLFESDYGSYALALIHNIHEEQDLLEKRVRLGSDFNLTLNDKSIDFDIVMLPQMGFVNLKTSSIKERELYRGMRTRAQQKWSFFRKRKFLPQEETFKAIPNSPKTEDIALALESVSSALSLFLQAQGKSNLSQKVKQSKNELFENYLSRNT